jgi:hypothetical protein
MVRLLLTNWLVGLLEAQLIWGEPHATLERSQANWVFVELNFVLEPIVELFKKLYAGVYNTCNFGFY